MVILAIISFINGLITRSLLLIYGSQWPSWKGYIKAFWPIFILWSVVVIEISQKSILYAVLNKASLKHDFRWKSELTLIEILMKLFKGDQQGLVSLKMYRNANLRKLKLIHTKSVFLGRYFPSEEGCIWLKPAGSLPFVMSPVKPIFIVIYLHISTNIT